MSQSSMTYGGVGVNYDALDPFKRAAQLAARSTSKWLIQHGLEEREWSRGESAYLFEQCTFGTGQHWAHVHEGLGTKNLVADAMERLTGRTYYDAIAQDTVAMGVNDLITLGAMPHTVAMHLAVGDSAWFENEARSNALIAGWVTACNFARCTWGGGETPTLKEVIFPEASELSCSVVGSVAEDWIIRPNIQHGDAIILLDSSGIHANGLTLARRIADKLPKGYLTELSDGRLYGEALLDPTVIYVGIIEYCKRADIKPHYVVNVTGHGWRKLMRAEQHRSYVVERIPEPQPVFRFMQEHGPVDEAEAYGNLNMGAGFALIVSNNDADRVVDLANGIGYSAMKAGYVDAEQGEGKRVIIEPLGLEWSGDTLGVR